MKTIRSFFKLNVPSPQRVFRLGLWLVCLFALLVRSDAAVLSWSGGGGANANWNSSANWGFVGTPASGDTLIFSASQPNLINTNNIAGLTLNQIRFLGAGGGYDLRGNAFTLTNNIVATNSVGANIISLDITLATTNQVVDVTDTLTISGQISGSVGVIKNGPGTLNYNGSSNPYSGTTTVNAGTLVLNCGALNAAFGGPLVINAATVKLTLDIEIPNNQPITINGGGLLDLNNLNEDISGNLTLNGGTVNVGTAALTIAAPSTITVTSGTINGTGAGSVNLGAGPCGINVSSGTLNVYPTVAGAAAITKSGAGSLNLRGANTYTGLTIVEAGFLRAYNNLALGATNGGTVVNGTAGLELQNAHITNEVLTLNSTLASGALQDNSTGDWVGPVTLSTNVFIEASSALGIDGPISGPGGFTKIGANTLTLRGTTANTYAGTTTVNGGTLVLGKPSSVNAVPTNLVLSGASSVVRLAADEQIAGTAAVQVNSGAVFDFATFFDGINTLSGTGNVTFGTNGYLDIGAANGTSTFDGVMSGVGYIGGYTVGKYGTGTFTMNANNTFQNGLAIYGGKLVVNGNQPQNSFPYTTTAGTLGGSGTVGSVTSFGGAIAPGTSPGILTCSNLAYTSSGNLTVELTGPTAGTQYDQLNIIGSSTIANASLTVLPAFTTPVALGQQFIIMNNDGSETNNGTFSGWPQGATNSLSGGHKFSISYTGGTGNDVVLTLIDVPVASVASAATVSAGNGDGVIAPNECNGLSVVITNKIGAVMTGVSATLASITPGVVVAEASSPFPNTPGNGKSTNSVPFQLATTPAFVCGTTINLQLTVTTASHGSFIVPVTIPTGTPTLTPVRFDNNTIVNVPDIGTIDSTNNVASWSGGPLTKVVVSLWLVAPFTSDMNLSLIAPNGTIIDLSSGNGAGANFGSGSADGSRTTFDDAAATAITAGASPFVGSFRPEVSLSTLAGTSPVVGNWRLRVNDAFGSGSPDTLRAWSLFLYGTDCGTGSGQCELCPNVTITSAVGPSTPFQTNYLANLGGSSVCGVPKACPGSLLGALPADNFAFRNGPSEACITVTVSNITVGGGIQIGAYAAGYNPGDTNRCNNYLADPGLYPPSGQATSFSFNVASNALFYVNILGGSYGNYKLTVTGGDCRPALNITDIGAGKAKLDWTTAAAGFQLEGTNTLTSGTSIWPGVTNSPLVSNSRYAVTNTVPSTNQFYHLRKFVP